MGYWFLSGSDLDRASVSVERLYAVLQFTGIDAVLQLWT